MAPLSLTIWAVVAPSRCATNEVAAARGGWIDDDEELVVGLHQRLRPRFCRFGDVGRRLFAMRRSFELACAAWTRDCPFS